MPSSWHDQTVKLFTDNPGLAVRVLRDWAGADIPPALGARAEKPTFNDRPSSDFNPDVIVVRGPSLEPAHVIDVEVQQAKAEGKLIQMARYAAYAWLYLRCPVTVLVICPPDQKVVDFYSQPVPTSLPGYTFRARVLRSPDVPP